MAILCNKNSYLTIFNKILIKNYCNLYLIVILLIIKHIYLISICMRCLWLIVWFVLIMIIKSCASIRC